MTRHPVLVEILQKFIVQLHQLTLNAIVQIGKFIWVIISCGGSSTINRKKFGLRAIKLLYPGSLGALRSTLAITYAG
jgi:hypothetical protein